MDFQAPLPPPPPPPTNGMFSLNHPAPLHLNANRDLSDRSQLLIDIEKGKSLKRVANAQNGLNSRPVNQISSSNECNGIDNNNYNEDSANPIKNQLQAELCSTLHRRQNGGNKKPNFIVPKNTTINAINNQLRELQNNAPSQPTTNGKTTTEVTPTISQSATTNAKDKEEKPKLLISHGKPNFKISSNSMSSKKFLEKEENSASNELFGTLRRRLKSVESLDEIDPINKSAGKSLHAHAQQYVPEPQKVAEESRKTVQVPLKSVHHEQPNSAARIEAIGVPKSPIAPPLFYKASVKNFNTVTNNVSVSSTETTKSSEQLDGSNRSNC